LLNACDAPQVEPVKIEPVKKTNDQEVKETKPHSDKLPAAKAEKLNLDITTEMMEETLDSIDVNEAGKDTRPVLDLHRSKEHQRIQLKGDVLQDKAEQDYIKSVDGAVLEVEVEFE